MTFTKSNLKELFKVCDFEVGGGGGRGGGSQPLKARKLGFGNWGY